MAVIRRDKSASTGDLMVAISRLVPLLQNQKEEDAVEALLAAAKLLEDAAPGTKGHREAIEKIIDAFEGEFELMACTFQRQNSDNEWTEADQLSQASSRVLTLARRMKA
jgi:hypothetical protein